MSVQVMPIGAATNYVIKLILSTLLSCQQQCYCTCLYRPLLTHCPISISLLLPRTQYLNRLFLLADRATGTKQLATRDCE